MASEVNQTSADLQRQEEASDKSFRASAAERVAAQQVGSAPIEPEPEREFAVLEGTLCTTSSGALRALQLLTGVALLRWLGLGILQLLGYGHLARLEVRQGKLYLEGKRRLLGLDLGATQQAIPLTQLLGITTAARSGAWALVAALVVMIITAALGSLLALWGIAGRQVSWGLLGVLVMACGVLLDALAYLLVRRSCKEGLVDLVVHTPRLRLTLRRQPAAAAAQLLERLDSRQS